MSALPEYLLCCMRRRQTAKKLDNLGASHDILHQVNTWTVRRYWLSFLRGFQLVATAETATSLPQRANRACQSPIHMQDIQNSHSAPTTSRSCGIFCSGIGRWQKTRKSWSASCYFKTNYWGVVKDANCTMYSCGHPSLSKTCKMQRCRWNVGYITRNWFRNAPWRYKKLANWSYGPIVAANIIKDLWSLKFQRTRLTDRSG